MSVSKLGGIEMTFEEIAKYLETSLSIDCPRLTDLPILYGEITFTFLGKVSSLGTPHA
jgi:hypothetical protein